MNLRVIIDRFEEDKVVLYTEKGMMVLDRNVLPDEIKEGDVLEYNDEKYILCPGITEEKKKNNISKLNELKNKKHI